MAREEVQAEYHEAGEPGSKNCFLLIADAQLGKKKWSLGESLVRLDSYLLCKPLEKTIHCFKLP